MLPGDFSGVRGAKTKGDFLHEIVRFSNQLGFKYVSAMTVIDESLTRSLFENVHNTPDAYSSSFNDTVEARRDPVMQHCKRDTVPIIWDQDTYVSGGQGELWEHQAHFGYQTGIALALHMPGGRHFFMGVDRDKSLPEKPKTMARIVADLQLFAVFAQDAAFRLFDPLNNVEMPHLTARELEALRWTMDSKTAWEVGVIMNISERTAVFHVHNAMRKLGCSDKMQAALKASRLGLL
ncbi:MAG TPA: autoinducer binding domain-containing protein [Burkholderiaceae bacterium]|nr:autoinducer binding domain-containing protein [Burkholderiaceae bacterium]